MGQSKDELSVKSESQAQVARFGVFEFRLDTGELRKDGASVRLQRRSFCVLRALLERQGEVVTREELRGRIWSEGTYVDFESGLNTAVNRLRCALGDSAEAPVYVETMARLGYRFIAPVSYPAMTRETGATERASVSGLPTPMHGRRWWMAAAGMSLLGTVLVWLGVTAFPGQRPFHYKQLTFSAGWVETARFLGDGREVVYRLRLRGKVREAFKVRSDGEDAARPQALNAAEEEKELGEGSLGSRINSKDGWFAVEAPVGRTLYRTRGRLEVVRVAPRGDRVAFIEHSEDDDGGCLMVASATEAAHCLSGRWDTIQSLAWTPSGDEIWFTAGRTGADQNLRAVNLRGRVRPVAEMPGGMMVLDISRAGEVLIARPSGGAGVISADGKSVPFDESGRGGEGRPSVYLQNLEHNREMNLSRDELWGFYEGWESVLRLYVVSGWR